MSAFKQIIGVIWAAVCLGSVMVAMVIFPWAGLFLLWRPKKRFEGLFEARR
jgi:hypothetical protein